MKKEFAKTNVFDITYNAYDYYGYHKKEKEFSFKVWAPHAEQVCLVGDFCNWKNGIPMTRLENSGIWEIVLSDILISVGDKYKFKIFGNNSVHYKSDPYAKRCEGGEGNASVIPDEDNEYTWRDEGWLEYRRLNFSKRVSFPMNIYEVHLGTWKRYEDGSPYRYEKLASELATYVKQMGYTHIEVLPIMEGAYGRGKNQAGCSFYSPTAKYGTPEEFKSFVNIMHEAGVGVILDWKVDRFSDDEHGLNAFDGDFLYESSADRAFDFKKKEVVDFIASNAIYYIKEYHIDGLCVKDLGNIINAEGGEYFIRSLTAYIKANYTDVLLVADGAKELLDVTCAKDKGLGFDLKKDQAWATDIFEYIKEDPIFRKHHHEKTTYSLTYAFSESFALPLSCDLACNEGSSLLDKAHGDYWQKFATVRALFGYMMTHPGKKISFMGNELGQFCQWNPSKELEWFLLEYESHARLQSYVSELNNFYLSSSELWQNDNSWNGFSWIDPNNRNQSILSYRRIDTKGKELVVVINFTPVVYENFRLGVSNGGIYTEVFNSDRTEFGGSGVINDGNIKADSAPCNFQKCSINIRIPPLAITVFQLKRKASQKN